MVVGETELAHIDEVFSHNKCEFRHFLDNKDSYDDLKVASLVLVGEVNKLLNDFLEAFCELHLLL